MLDEALVYIRVDLPVDRPLHDAIPESKRHHQACFGIMDVKLSIAPYRICLIEKVLLDVEKILLQMKTECDDFIPVSLVARRFFVGAQQIVPGTDVVFQILQLLQMTASLPCVAKGSKHRLPVGLPTARGSFCTNR